MNYFLGAELNGSQLKISTFRKRGPSYELIKLDKFNYPEEANEATNVLSSWVSRVLPDQTSIKAVLTISESSLYIKEIKLPKLESAKLNEAVYWEIPTFTPIPQAEAVYDWLVISEEKGMLNILVIVGQNYHIQNIISTFRNAQIDVVAIEPSSYSFARVANAPFNTNTLLCLVEEQGTEFIVLKNGIPFFSTSRTGQSQSEKMRQIKSGTDLTNDIVGEGKKLISYWETKESLKIHQVVIAGDVVYKYIGLSTSLNLFPPLPCYIGTYKKNRAIKVNSDYKDLELGSYLTSIGAGMRNLQKDPSEGINLFPSAEKQKKEKIKKQQKTTSNFMGFVYANVFILIILFISTIVLNMWWYSLEKQYSEFDKTLTNHPANAYISDVNKINSTIENVAVLTKQQDDVGAKLKIISDLTPQSVKISSVNFSSVNKLPEWTIKGTGDKKSVLAYYKKLSQNIKATEITMPYSNFENSTENDFSISIKW